MLTPFALACAVGLAGCREAPSHRGLLRESADPAASATLLARVRVCDAAREPVIRSLAVSDDGKHLAVQEAHGEEDVIRLWEVGTSRLLCSFEPASRAQIFSFSPNGTMLALSLDQDTVLLCDASTGEVHRKLNAEEARAYFAAFSPDGRALACGDGDIVVIWDINTGARRATLSAPDHEMNCVVFSPDGKQMATGGSDSTIRLWDLESRTERLRMPVWREEGVFQLGYSPGGTKLAAGCGGLMSHHYSLRLWHIPSRAQVLDRDAYWSCPISFAPDGRVLTVTDKRLVAVDPFPSTVRDDVMLIDCSSGYYPVALSPCSTAFAAGSPDDNTVAVWTLTWDRQEDLWPD